MDQLPMPKSDPHSPYTLPTAPRRRRLRSALALGATGAMILTAGVLSGMTPPEPDPIPRRWQLDVEVGPLRVATFDVKDEGKRAYFYMTYKVTNNSGEDLLFAHLLVDLVREEKLTELTGQRLVGIQVQDLDVLLGDR